ncbi:efflux RND transporter periplasmic adaptor subunit [Thermicanus aegyptius]|uniref:efflux RND transporter periplasmic adaptor subunit n=1 Tax=Thermicanus aegyptius TaxID=94009 RepID=UPI0004295998|nr:efflux RND transporter periplasmic adaptor subunit [Thermicanus aegyptius]
MKKWIFIVLAVLIAGAGIFVYFLQKGKQPVAAQRITAPVQRGNLTIQVSGTGSVTPVNKESVTATETGVVNEVLFQEGDKVEKGQVLVTFKGSDLSDQIQQEEFNLQQLNTQLQNAQKKMNDQKEKSTVTSPADGNLISLNVNVGDEVQANSVLGTVQRVNTSTITVPFNQAQVADVKVGQKAEVFILDNFETVEGTVKEVDTLGRTTESGVNYYDVTVEVEQKMDSSFSAQVSVVTPKGKVQALEKGTFKPAEIFEIKAKTSGTVSKILVSKQAYVRTGQAVVLLETDIDTSNIDQLNNQILQAKERIKSYQEQQAAPSPILAPLSGEILTRDVEPGAEVKAGQAVAEIANYQDYQMVIAVDELDISKVKVGQIADVTLNALPDQKLKGEVTKIAEEGTVNNGVATFDVTILLQESKGIRSGMTGEAVITVQEKQNVLYVPIEAVQKRGNQYMVLTASRNAGSTGENIQMKQVEVGISNEDYIEITNGLSEGDEVILPTVTTNRSQQLNRFPGGFPGGMGGFQGGGTRGGFRNSTGGGNR